MLEKINSPEDIKKLNIEEKKQLAEEIRKYIIKVVSENGGHLASNLGAVELTLALHSTFNTPKDKIVWDVGHQSYTHKIITGRREQFKTLRKLDGLAGFPKTSESEYDSFNTGHSSIRNGKSKRFKRRKQPGNSSDRRWSINRRNGTRSFK